MNNSFSVNISRAQLILYTVPAYPHTRARVYIYFELIIEIMVIMVYSTRFEMGFRRFRPNARGKRVQLASFDHNYVGITHVVSYHEKILIFVQSMYTNNKVVLPIRRICTLVRVRTCLFIFSFCIMLPSEWVFFDLKMKFYQLEKCRFGGRGLDTVDFFRSSQLHYCLKFFF